MFVVRPRSSVLVEQLNLVVHHASNYYGCLNIYGIKQVVVGNVHWFIATDLMFLHQLL